jgi:integrase
MDKKIKSSKIDVAARAKEYREPEVCWGKNCVTVSFYAFDPCSGSLRRKRMKLNRELKGISGKRAQREYVKGVVDRLRDELKAGWNPWMQQSDGLVYARWDEVCERYKAYLVKQLNEHNMRQESVASYMSYQRVLMRWVAAERKNVRYAYQFDRRLVDAFLDHVYLDKDNSIQTRNNYLSWVKSFSTWMLGKSYIEQDPTAGIPRMKIRKKTKNRDVIPDSVLQGIHDYLQAHNRHFLLACYLLHYLFVRPHEIAQLKIEDFSLSRKTLLIHGDVAKNWQDAVVTLPVHVIELMIDLGVFRSPGSYYLFSEGFRPGREFRSEKFFRDYWTRVLRKELKFSDRYKFYSLKDTGITNMLRANTDVLSVRDQARHSSILITDIYTPKDIRQANELLVNYRGVL